jgi:uncharacterized protein YjbJ (UPF0337 family)
MDENRIDGKADKLKGNVKEALGKATGDRSMQAEGMIDQAKGAVKDAFGKAKDEIRAEDRRLDEKGL